jgi:hypothetical protein
MRTDIIQMIQAKGTRRELILTLSLSAEGSFTD